MNCKSFEVHETVILKASNSAVASTSKSDSWDDENIDFPYYEMPSRVVEA